MKSDYDKIFEENAVKILYNDIKSKMKNYCKILQR